MAVFGCAADRLDGQVDPTARNAGGDALRHRIFLAIRGAYAKLDEGYAIKPPALGSALGRGQYSHARSVGDHSRDAADRRPPARATFGRERPGERNADHAGSEPAAQRTVGV